MMQNAGVFDILTCKCAWRHSGVPFFHHISTSELQKVVRDRQFFNILTCKCASRYSGVQFLDIAPSKKWSAPEVLCTFSLENVLLATPACNFSTSQLQKVVRTWCVLCIFDLKMCFSLQRRAIFPHRNFKKWSETVSFLTF